MTHQQILELLQVVGALIISAVCGVIGAALRLAKSDTVSQEQLSDTKDHIYSDMENRIEKAKKDLKEDHNKFEEKVEKEFNAVQGKLDEFGNKQDKMALCIESIKTTQDLILQYFQLMPKRKTDDG